MKNRVCLILLVICCQATFALAQTPSSTAYRDPMSALSADVTKISTSVRTLTDTLKAFVDKWEKVSGLTLSEKQQRLVMGMELLSRSEQRVVTFQKAQIELTEKYNATRNRIAQVEIELRPRNITNSTTYAGTTETEELRESRTKRLQSERTSLTQLLASIQTSLTQTSDDLRDAQGLAYRLRMTFLPQVERELYEQ